MATSTTPARKTAAARQLAEDAPRTVTVAVDGEVYTYPDVAERYDAWRCEPTRRLLGRWAADRIAARVLDAHHPALEALHVWVYMDDNPVAYLVQYTRKARGRMPKAEIVGAAKYAEGAAPDLAPEGEL